MQSRILFALLLGLPRCRAIAASVSPTYWREKSARWVEDPVICGLRSTPRDFVGYVEVGDQGEDMDMWFWFFEAQNDPKNAPIALVLPGTPGLAGSELVFGRNGVCAWEPREPWPVANEWSFNRHVNMLYLDTPLPAGLSFIRGAGGHSKATKRSEVYVWNFLQVFFRYWPEYLDKQLHLWTQDFGAYFATKLAVHVLDNNQLIDKGELPDQVKVNLTSLGLESPLIDVSTQYKHSLAYALENPYRDILSAEEHAELGREFEAIYQRRLQACAANLERDCEKHMADYEYLWKKLTVGAWTSDRGILEQKWEGRRISFDPRDIRLERPRRTFESLYGRPEHVSQLQNWLRRPAVKERLGLQRETWDRKEDYKVFDSMEKLSDASVENVLDKEQALLRPSFARLERIVQSGIRTLLVCGDADLISSPPGLQAMAEKIEWPGRGDFLNTSMHPVFATLELADGPKDLNYSPDDQTLVGRYKSSGNLAWMALYGQGHDIGKDYPGITRNIFEDHVLGREYSHWEHVEP